ncbi:hypothetical protein DMN91_011375 [Ooceraea biroi]|uniref:RNMT-activating mini protein n=1 Tax=Ooceraea biroi TaxID=2015173 RepID=A0A026WQH7_OOCBI|nr:uncharacterized protein LOC105276593 [Ooceraea biroi]XP_019886330.1 uncharacterized protein LOC105276593 [Ooceraea biroi]EZA58188.1 hypothetical protein X777_01552 [Ooceraea biroi]RLU15622.1 hypothetical protein DMN91_011375 [Ooceraea biroi]
MTDITLTTEQRKFLEECEEEFKDRYTEKDNSFMNIKMQELKKPPIVDPWYNKPRRYEWSRHDQTHTHGRRNHYWNRRNNDRSERMDRHGRR